MTSLERPAPSTTCEGVDPEVERDVDDAVLEAGGDGESRVVEEVEHPSVVRQDLSGEALDTELPGTSGQSFEQSRAEAFALPDVRDDEGGLCLAAIGEPVEAGDP